MGMIFQSQSIVEAWVTHRAIPWGMPKLPGWLDYIESGHEQHTVSRDNNTGVGGGREQAFI